MNLSQKFGLLLIKAGAFFITIMPRMIKTIIGKFLGSLWFDVFRIRRDIIMSNLDIVFPNKTLKEKIRIGRQSCHHMGHSFVEAAELVFLKKDKKSKDRFIVNGLEHLQEAYKKEKGVCLLTLHLGNPDFSIVGVGLHDIKLNVISKDFSIDWLNNIWFGLRERFGTQFIKSKNSAYHILKALKRNEAVVFVQDQFMPHPHGIRTQFFGKYTGTAAGLAALSFRSGAPVVPVYAYRDGEGKTVIVFEKEIRFQRSDNYVEDLLQFTQLCNHKLEEIVLKKPEQWMWVHRRWKKFPKK